MTFSEKQKTKWIKGLLLAAAVGALLLSLVFFRDLLGEIRSRGRGAGTGAGQTAYYVETAAIPGEEDVVFRQGRADSGKAAITCNVDWGEDQLPAILQILEDRNTRITFFVSGKWAEEHPALLRELYLRGHEVQSHGYSHKLCSDVSAETVRSELEKTALSLETLLGYTPTVFAPPSGDYDAKTLSLCRKLGYRVSLWSADTIDWQEGSTAEVILKRLRKKELQGGVILMHPKPETVKALPAILDLLQQQGIAPVTVTELLQDSGQVSLQ